MKTFWVTALAGLSLVATMGATSAQRAERDYGSDEREYRGRDYEGDGGRRGDRYDDDRRPGRGRAYDDDRGGARDRGYDEGRDRQRGRGYDDEDRGSERRRGKEENRGAEFDEDEYLRCNPDVRRAVERGEMKSGAFHYRTYGRREGRRLTCETKL